MDVSPFLGLPKGNGTANGSRSVRSHSITILGARTRFGKQRRVVCGAIMPSIFLGWHAFTGAAGVGMLVNMLTRRIARRESMPPFNGARIICHTPKGGRDSGSAREREGGRGKAQRAPEDPNSGGIAPVRPCQPTRARKHPARVWREPCRVFRRTRPRL